MPKELNEAPFLHPRNDCPVRALPVDIYAFHTSCFIHSFCVGRSHSDASESRCRLAARQENEPGCCHNNLRCFFNTADSSYRLVYYFTSCPCRRGFSPNENE